VKRKLCLVLWLVCVIALGPWSAPSAINAATAARPSAAAGPIVFLSHRDGSAELYAMDADGSNQQRLTYNACKE
jgi:hypothetical protein